MKRMRLGGGGGNAEMAASGERLVPRFSLPNINLQTTNKLTSGGRRRWDSGRTSQRANWIGERVCGLGLDWLLFFWIFE